jgi:hypothetical protein
MNAALRAFVRERAGRRCEYCRLHADDGDFLSFLKIIQPSRVMLRENLLFEGRFPPEE